MTTALIGGTGLERLPPEFRTEDVFVETSFGPVHLILALNGNDEILFLSRHGGDHGIPPHRINFQRNIEALRLLGVEEIIATNAVGSLRYELRPGTLVLYDDFIDMTRRRALSFWDGHPDAPTSVNHTDFTVPYSSHLRDKLQSAAERLKIDVVGNGTYVCVDGPRFESPAEVRLFGRWGGDVVGMTGLPEAIFAREAGIAYAGIGIVTNLGAGMSLRPVKHEEVVEQMEGAVERVHRIVWETIKYQSSTSSPTSSESSFSSFSAL